MLVETGGEDNEPQQEGRYDPKEEADKILREYNPQREIVDILSYNPNQEVEEILKVGAPAKDPQEFIAEGSAFAQALDWSSQTKRQIQDEYRARRLEQGTEFDADTIQQAQDRYYKAQPSQAPFLSPEQQEHFYTIEDALRGYGEMKKEYESPSCPDSLRRYLGERLPVKQQELIKLIEQTPR
jgi:hypothetical protein